MFYMFVENGIVKSVGQMTADFREISESDYQTAQQRLDNKPTPPDKKHDYRLTEALEWELFEIDGNTEVDDSQTVEILLGGAE